MKQNVFDSESRSDLSFTVQKVTEGDSQRSQRKNEYQLLLEGEPVRILGNTSTEGFGEENTKNACKKGSHDYTLCDTEDTSKDGYTQTKLTPESIDEQIVDVRVPLSILKETVASDEFGPT